MDNKAESSHEDDIVTSQSVISIQSEDSFEQLLNRRQEADIIKEYLVQQYNIKGQKLEIVALFFLFLIYYNKDVDNISVEIFEPTSNALTERIIKAISKIFNKPESDILNIVKTKIVKNIIVDVSSLNALIFTKERISLEDITPMRPDVEVEVRNGKPVIYIYDGTENVRPTRKKYLVEVSTFHKPGPFDLLLGKYRLILDNLEEICKVLFEKRKDFFMAKTKSAADKALKELPWLSLDEIAQDTGIEEDTVKQLINNKHIKTYTGIYLVKDLLKNSNGQTWEEMVEKPFNQPTEEKVIKYIKENKKSPSYDYVKKNDKILDIIPVVSPPRGVFTGVLQKVWKEILFPYLEDIYKRKGWNVKQDTVKRELENGKDKILVGRKRELGKRIKTEYYLLLRPKEFKQAMRDFHKKRTIELVKQATADNLSENISKIKISLHRSGIKLRKKAYSIGKDIVSLFGDDYSYNNIIGKIAQKVSLRK